MQHGQVFAKGPSNWAYRYRLGGRDSKPTQRSVFATEEAAEQALDRALERARQEQGLAQTPTLGELVEIYLAQHDTEPETVEKLRWLLSKATAAFGNTSIGELQPAAIAAWRTTIRYGHRFEAASPAPDVGARRPVANDQRQARQAGRREPPTRPASSNGHSSPGTSSNGSPTSLPTPKPDRPVRSRDRLRPSEWLALEHRDIDRAAGVVYVRRAYRTAASNTRKPPPATAPSPSRRSRLTRSTRSRHEPGQRSSSPPPAAATSTCTTSATATGNPPNATSQSTRSGAYRSQAHLRHVRAPRRHLHLRPLPLHGRQPDDDRPPLRAPRQRRPPARDRPPRQLQQQPRPHGGREVDATRGHAQRPGRKTPSKQDKRQSPLSDSNRRPLPYHGRTGVFRAFTGAH